MDPLQIAWTPLARVQMYGFVASLVPSSIHVVFLAQVQMYEIVAFLVLSSIQEFLFFARFPISNGLGLARLHVFSAGPYHA